jgi:integrase
MRQAPKLQRRRSGFYFRYKLPADIAALLGKTEIVRSLNTKLKVDAVRHHLMVTYRVDGAIRMTRELQAQDRAEVEAIFRKWFEAELESDFVRRMEVQRRPVLAIRSETPLSRTIETVKRLIGPVPADVEAQRTARSFATSAGVTLTPEQLNHLASLVLHGLNELKMNIGPRRAAGDYSDIIKDGSVKAALHSPARSEVAASVVTSPSGDCLGTIMEEFLAEIGPSLQVKTKLDYEHSFQLARDLFGGERDPATITIKEAREFKQLLLKYPSNATKKYPGQDFKTAVESGSRDNAPVLAPKSINKKLSNLNSLFAWAKDNGYVEANVFTRLAVPDKISAKSKRDPFTSEQINAIFSNGVFSAGRTAPFDACSRDAEDFWVTLIGYFTGMRLGEIAQLGTADIRQEHGVWIFDVHNRGERRLKTEVSRRRVPVHSELVRLGLLAHRDGVEARGHSALFPNLLPASDGYQSSAYSKRFAIFLKRIGVKVDRRVSFHSLRHTMKDMLRAAGVGETVQRELMGHENGSAAAQYGRGYSLVQLKQELERIEVHPTVCRLASCDQRTR